MYCKDQWNTKKELDYFRLNFSQLSQAATFSKHFSCANTVFMSSIALLLTCGFCYTDNITYGHIANSFPYKNTVDIVDLKGKDLVQVFEQVASLYDESNPSASFLQVSGTF